MSDKQKYLKELSEELGKLPLKKRLLQELEDHLDDMTEDTKEPLNFTTMTQKMGKPKYIKDCYYELMNPLRGLYFAAEGLFYGLLLLPLGLGSFLLTGLIMDFLYSPFQSVGLVLSVVLATAALVALWFIGFALVFNHWRKLNTNTGYPLWAWIVLVMLPSCILWGNTFFTLLGTFFECPSCNENPTRDLVSIVGAGVSTVLLLVFAARLAWKKSKLHLRRSKGLWTKRISIGLFIYLSLYSVVRTGESYGLWETLPEGIDFLMIAFTPMFLLEFMAMVFGTFLFRGGAEESLVYGPLGITILGLILVFIVALFIVDLIKNKRMAWLRAGVAVCALSLLLVKADAFVPSIEWSKPVQRISENIEQEQHGIFYGLLKYSNQDEGQFYRYNVAWENEAFTVTQNTGKVFKIEPKNLDEETYEQVVKLATSTPTFSEDTLVWPEGLECISREENGVISIQSEGDFYSCSTITWKSEPVLNVEYWITVREVVISPDNEWLVLLVQPGAYDPEYVYLIELQ